MERCQKPSHHGILWALHWKSKTSWHIFEGHFGASCRSSCECYSLGTNVGSGTTSGSWKSVSLWNENHSLKQLVHQNQIARHSETLYIHLFQSNICLISIVFPLHLRGSHLVKAINLTSNYCSFWKWLADCLVDLVPLLARSSWSPKMNLEIFVGKRQNLPTTSEIGNIEGKKTVSVTQVCNLTSFFLPHWQIIMIFPAFSIGEGSEFSDVLHKESTEKLLWSLAEIQHP